MHLTGQAEDTESILPQAERVLYDRLTQMDAFLQVNHRRVAIFYLENIPEGMSCFIQSPSPDWIKE